MSGLTAHAVSARAAVSSRAALRPRRSTARVPAVRRPAVAAGTPHLHHLPRCEISFARHLAIATIDHLASTQLDSDTYYPSPQTPPADVDALPANLKKIIGAFQMVPDPMSRYKQLLFFAAKLKEFPEIERTESNKVPGCVSQVWVVPTIQDDGTVTFVADSDSQLTKGLAALLVEGLSGATPKEIFAVEPDFVELLGLGQSLTPSRTNGFMNMLRLMQKKTLEAFMAAEAAKE